MPSKTRRVQTTLRAEVYFNLYYSLGPDRTVERLAAECKSYGLKISRNTLAHYSARDKWLERVAQRDAQVAEVREGKRIGDLMKMNERQALLGAAMQNVAAEALGRLRGQDGKLREALAAGEIATIVREGVKTERLARGAATDRTEIAVEIWTTVIREIVDIFQTVNVIDDPTVRAREFADGVDTKVQSHLLLIGARIATEE